LAEDTRETILAYLRAHNSLTIATCDGPGAWAAAVFYVNDGFTLYYLSDPKSRHSLGLADNPNVAATIHEDYRDWRLIKGLQIAGRAELVGSIFEKAAALRLYLEKFPFVADMLRPSTAIARLVSAKTRGVEWYRLIPSRIVYIDNEISFGHRDELVL
jgi:uncharacterized protein